MNSTKCAFVQEKKIHKLSSLFAPISWGTLFVFIIGAALIPILSKGSGMSPSDTIERTIMAILYPVLRWVPLLYLMTRFFVSSKHNGVFSDQTIRLMRWISAVFLFFAVSGTISMIVSLFYIPIPYFFAMHVGPTLTNLMLGFFLLMLSYVLKEARLLKNENQLTI